MGLDMVELLVAVEVTFAIQVDDGEFQEITTVGDLHALVMSKISARSSADPIECAKVATFNRLRRALTEVAAVSRADIRPGVAIGGLIHPRDRRAAWSKLSEQSELFLPALTAPKWLLYFALAVSATACIAVYLAYSLSWTLVLVFGGAMLAILKTTKPLHVELPEGIKTVGDLTRAAAARNHTLVAHGRRYTSPDQIWDALVEIIVEQLSIERSLVKPEAEFAGDLKVD